MNKLKQNCETKSENYQYENKLEFTVNVFQSFYLFKTYLDGIKDTLLCKPEKVKRSSKSTMVAWQSSTIDSLNPNTKTYISFFVCSTSK